MVLWRHEVRDGSVTFAFSNRHGGVSTGAFAELNLGGHVGDDADAVAENRRRVTKELGGEGAGLEVDHVLYMRQVHSADVAQVTQPWGDRIPQVDALVTDVSGLCVAVLVADCVPVLLADPVAGVVGAVHAGRVGMAAGVVPAAVERMTELGAKPARIVAAIGPSMCGSCYEVPDEMRADVAAKVPAAYAQTRQGTPGLDVAEGVWSQLAAAGVDLDASVRIPTCTFESPDYFSYRRDGTTGRIGGFVWLS